MTPPPSASRPSAPPSTAPLSPAPTRLAPPSSAFGFDCNNWLPTSGLLYAIEDEKPGTSSLLETDDAHQTTSATYAAYIALRPGEPVDNAPADILGTTRTMVTRRSKLRTALLRIIKGRCEMAPFGATQQRAEGPEKRSAQGAQAASATPGVPAGVAPAAGASLSALQADKLSAAQGAHAVPITPGLSMQGVIAPTASATWSVLNSNWNEVSTEVANDHEASAHAVVESADFSVSIQRRDEPCSHAGSD
jgi:hypothetical protein